jgi:hypothetical protein
MSRALAAIAFAIGCHAVPTPVIGSAAPRGSGAVAPLTGDGDRAFVVDATGLVEVARDGAQVVTADAIGWCSADARAQVVWFQTRDGVRAFDLVDRRVHAVVAGDVAELAIVIDWGKQQLGGEDGQAFDVAMKLAMTPAPAIAGGLGCDGDAYFSCYDEGKQLKPELVAKQRRVDALALADPAYVAALAARGQARELWAPPAPARAVAAPNVDRAACVVNPSECGKVIALGASSLVLVVTANDRGDYYDETRELWDPASSKFVRFADDGKLVRESKPTTSDVETYAGMRVAVDGTLTYRGVVFDARGVIRAPVTSEQLEAARSCGFARGGWRVAGPTG